MGSADPSGGPPSGSAGVRGALLLVVALVLGIVLLQQFDTGSPAFSPQQVTANSTTSTTRRAATVTVLPPVSTRPLRQPADIKVLPANGTSTSGLGGRTGELLRAAGYNALAPIDATRNVDATLVEHKPELEAEARVLAQLLQLPASSVRPLEENPPVPDTRGADIVVVIGSDLRLPGTTTSSSRP